MYFFFFFNDTATTEIYTLSLHDALPICRRDQDGGPGKYQADDEGGEELLQPALGQASHSVETPAQEPRSEEHTSELQSQSNLVCRLLLEKKKKKQTHSRKQNITR